LIMVRLHWINTYLPLIVPGAASAWGIFMMRQYVATLPTEMLEAARMDGAGEFGIYWRIVLPVIQPALAAWGILGFVGTWNDFLWPMIVLRGREMYTLMVAVATLPTSQGFDVPWGVIMAGATFAVAPLLILYAAGQRFFESGLTMGAMHG
jgi:ABC-type glycerol-3-phosphate transport system permease component